MKAELTLIHLVSEQTLQNLLPVMAFRPDRVVQVYSRGRHAGQLRSLPAAVRLLAEERTDYRSRQPEFVNHQLGEEHPTLNRVYVELTPLFDRPESTILNYTGGTKMMSVAAFRLALERGARAVYCDTSRRRFVWTPKAEAPEGLGFDRLGELLTVRLLATAHLGSAGDFRWEEATPALIRFGREAWAFKRQPARALREYLGAVRGHFRRFRDRIPSGRRELEALARSPLPTPPDDAVRGYLRAARRAGLLREVDGDYFPAFAGAEKKDEIRRQIERLSNLLEGSWLELFVFGRLSESPLVGDVKWSLAPRRRGQAVGETDVVCVDRRHLALRVISCKESLRRGAPLEHMEALVQRARTLGGLMARPTLAVLHAEEGEARQYRHWARILGIDLLVGDEISGARGSDRRSR